MPAFLNTHSYRRLRNRVFACWGLVVLASTGNAAQPQLSIDTAIAPYPRAQIIESVDTEVVDYRLAMGEMRKIRGVWAAEKEQRDAGKLQRITMQVPEGHSAKEVFEFYRKRFANIEARALYLCEERNCGSSNSWANEVFNVKQLYGLDQNQYYGIYEVINEKDEINYLVVYSVTRGNKRVLAHVELLHTQSVSSSAVAPSPRAILLQIEEQGYYVVSGLSLTPASDDESETNSQRLIIQKDHLNALVEAMRLDTQLDVRVVGHSNQSRDLDQQLATSKAYAENLKQELVNAGIKAERLDVHGVGGLAPARQSVEQSDADFRIELVPIPKRRFGR